jgi:hypothetical protein
VFLFISRSVVQLCHCYYHKVLSIKDIKVPHAVLLLIEVHDARGVELKYEHVGFIIYALPATTITKGVE